MSKLYNPLTKMQVSFCQNYIANGFNAYKAAIEAGYSHDKARKGVTQFLQKPEIKNAIQEASQASKISIVEKLGITFDWRAGKLRQIIESIVSDTEVRQQYAKTAIAAIAELNKMTGDYAPDKSLRLNVDMTKERLKDVKKAYEEY